MSEDQRAEIFYLIGRLIPLIGVLAIGGIAGNWLGNKRESKKFVWWPLLIAILLVAMSIPKMLTDVAVADNAAKSVESQAATEEGIVYKVLRDTKNVSPNSIDQISEDQAKTIGDKEASNFLNQMKRPNGSLSSSVAHRSISSVPVLEIRTLVNDKSFLIQDFFVQNDRPVTVFCILVYDRSASIFGQRCDRAVERAISDASYAGGFS